MAEVAPFIRPFRECSLAALSELGGKAARLGELVQAGFPVNPGFAVTTQAYVAFLESGPGRELDRLLSRLTVEDLASLGQVSGAIRRLIEASPIPVSVATAIAAAYRHLAAACGMPDMLVAVRSSATAECLADNSFAGQQETYLWVRGVDDVLRKTLACWSSLFTPQALSYRHKVGFPCERLAIGIAIQKMVDAKAAGVLFTLNPCDGDRSKIVIEANWGLGESVVAGEVDPDRYTLDKVTLEILARTIAAKRIEYAVDPSEDMVRRSTVPSERQRAACLTDQEVVALARIAKRIERHFGGAQDIEWAIDRHRDPPGNVVILQSRPETVWSRRASLPTNEVQPSAVGYVLHGLMSRAKRSPLRRS